jgi:hypothetical protein
MREASSGAVAVPAPASGIANRRLVRPNCSNMIHNRFEQHGSVKDQKFYDLSRIYHLILSICFITTRI